MDEDAHGEAAGRPVPDFGFFAGAASRTAGQPSEPVSRFGGPPTASPGPTASFAPPTPVGVAPPPFGAPGPGAPVYYPAPPRAGLPVWAIVAICVTGGLMLLGFLSAIAIPAFLSQREKAQAAATSVAVPSTIGSMSQTAASPDLQRQVQEWASTFPTVVTAPQAGAFVDADQRHSLIVVAGKFQRVPSASNRDEFVRGFWVSASRNAAATFGAPHDVSPGSAGGRLSCAETRAGAANGQLCVGVDPGAVVIIVDLRSGGAVDPDFPRTVRDAVVHRR